MASYSTTSSRSSGPVLRSISPSTRFNHSSFASTSSSAFSTPARAVHRATSTSTTNSNLYNYNSQSLNFSLNRSGSPHRSISTNRPVQPSTGSAPRKRSSCMCSPTNHPGSFRCSMHKQTGSNETQRTVVSCGSSSRLNMRRSAMKNSLVRIGTVEGELVKRALAALIRPSSHNQRRRGEFRPRPSRLSNVSSA